MKNPSDFYGRGTYPTGKRSQTGFDIGGGSTELVIGENFEPILLKAAGWVVSALPSFISLAGSQ